MTWNWSHSAEAYSAFEQNVHDMPREWLVTVYAEWNAYSPRAVNSYSLRSAMRAEVRAKSLPEDALADYIVKRARKQQLCSNGGHMAWACPYGCTPHMVGFSRKGLDDARNDADLEETGTA